MEVNELVIIEEDMKLGTKRKVSFDETFRNLIVTNGLARVELNYLLLSNIKISNDRFVYQRQINGHELKRNIKGGLICHTK